MLSVEIIISAYNIENYIGSCIQSVLNQDYDNWHLFIVNDGSNDSTLKCIKENLKDVDSKMYTLVCQKNRGLSASRNYALDHLQGDCLIFLDGDDLLPKNYVSSLVSVMEQTNSDIVACPFVKFSSTNSISENITSGCKIEIIDNIDFLQRLTTLSLPTGIEVSAHSKLYKNKCWNTLRFPTGKLFEDSFVIFDLLQNIKKIALTNFTHYLYRYRSESIVNSAFNMTRLQYIEGEQLLYNKIQSTYPNTELASHSHIRLEHVYLNTMMHIAFANDSRFYNLEKKLKPAALGKNPMHSVFLEKIPLVDRIGRLALLFGLPVFNVASRVFEKIKRKN